MLGLGYVRQRLGSIGEMLRSRGVGLDLGPFGEIDGERRKVVRSAEQMEAEPPAGSGQGDNTSGGIASLKSVRILEAGGVRRSWRRRICFAPSAAMLFFCRAAASVSLRDWLPDACASGRPNRSAESGRQLSLAANGPRSPENAADPGDFAIRGSSKAPPAGSR